MLAQQYELARIQEAKDVPVVRVIDFPGVPEKKSFPPRTLLSSLSTLLISIALVLRILARNRWEQLRVDDPRRELFQRIGEDVRTQVQRIRFRSEKVL
jgi:hypothetical protein